MKEWLINLFNSKRRIQTFKRIGSFENFEVLERKKYYEMVFFDGSITQLPKKILIFQNRLSKDDKASLKVGKCTYLQNSKIGIQQDQQVIIGSFCSFGPNVSIKLDAVRGKLQFTSYPLNLIDPSSEAFRKQNELTKECFVKIGNDCFIGEDSKILANVVISDGVILGERSFVPAGKYLEPYGIYVGQPVRLIGYRYDDETIQELLRLQWWNWSQEKIFNSGLQHLDFVNSKVEALLKLKSLEQ